MKKIIFALIVIIILVLIRLLLFTNSIKEVTNIEMIKICKQSDAIKISGFEPAYYIKTDNTDLKKNGDTLSITLFKTSVYSIGYSNLSGDFQFQIGKNIRYIKICKKLLEVSSINNCD